MQRMVARSFKLFASLALIGFLFAACGGGGGGGSKAVSQ